MIFVNIAAYRDPEIEPTLRSLFDRAAAPDQINVVVVLQAAPDDRFLFSHSRVRWVHVNADETRGACWARALGYRLWDDESFVLQTDSHMRFAQDWDRRAIEQLDRCPSIKPILTTYAPPYEPPNDLRGNSPTFLVPIRFNKDGYLEQNSHIHSSAKEPRCVALLSANFLFTKSEWIQEVPYDPQLYFSGEEPTLAVRSWTNGWDMFGPSEPLCWHRYGREGRATHWGDHPDWWRLNVKSLARTRQILGMEDGKIEGRYGLGTVRSLDDYQSWSGINFKARTIAQHALEGKQHALG